MKALIQRVSSASVKSQNETLGEIDQGLVVLLGVEQEDEKIDGEILAKKLGDLRIFSNEEGKFDLSLRDVKGEILVISQFTLCAEYKKGRRPSFTQAARPDKANELYEEFITLFQNDADISKVATGRFAADMQVTINNNGPVTMQLDSAQLK
ncbi:D-tyrosyl-tRNA deacylase [Lentisphaera araneosa HTCC2155]|uniref:D-aminoacyl-tRNA deacylase n=1 Tax=Lentisphaera araneosa HTCC2155 TaxID=313628 RepID=A6DPQ4_9BACT|nr:D-aminoacyl-tRNA deacylase [Lentisphaera araneosa]EDM26349.1 D-tyrosyl-tRNA deacylase [Lentisphaera araneosa HTCC2155]